MMEKLCDLEHDMIRGKRPYWQDDPVLEAQYGIVFDETECARGRSCCAWTDDHRYPARVGPYLIENYYTGAASTGWADCCFFESAPQHLFCEDCAISMERYAGEDAADPDYSVLDGQDGGLSWFIELLPPGEHDWFYAWVARFAPDHGMTWEDDVGTYGTLAEAIAGVDVYIARIAASDLAVERKMDELIAQDEWEVQA